MNTESRFLFVLILCVAVLFSVNSHAQNTTAKTFLLVETPGLDKGVYDMTKGPNSAPLFIPQHNHPTTGVAVPATTINCDRMENIYVTFEKDNSVLPETVTPARYASYYTGALPCANVRTFTVTYAHPAGGTRTEPIEVTWDVNQGVLFYKRNVDPKSSWGADDTSNHDYATHLGHIAVIDGLDRKGNMSSVFRTAICYPHSFWGTVPAGVDRTPVQMVDRPCEGKPCGTMTEAWGQTPTGAIWLPNGVWYHDDHTDRTTAGRRGGHVDPCGKIKRFCFSVVDIYVALEKQEKAGTPEYNNDIQVSNKVIEDAEAVYWQLAQCADACDSSTGNTVTAGTGLKPTSYEIVMGPSGNIYMYSPYLTPSIQFLKADPVTGAPPPGAAWQPYDWKGTDAGHTINVNCKSDLSDMMHIGVATKDATTDWLYFSSDDKFAVGDQFSGHGGVLYCGNFQPGGGLKVDHIQDIAQNHTVAASGPGQSYPNHANMVDVPVPANVLEFSADGMGSFYYITKKGFGPWKVVSYIPTPPVWTNAADIGQPLCLKAKANLLQEFQTTLHVREFDHQTKQCVPASQTKVAYTLNAGYRTNVGWDLKDDPSNPTPAPMPNPQINTAYPIIDHTHVDIATVVDASPPIIGECKVDIVPRDLSIKYANNIDFIPVEDGQAYEWEFENWQTDYTKDGCDSSGVALAVDNENGSVVDMVAPSATDPYENFIGQMGIAEKNPIHFNWGNQNRMTDVNGNGFTGGYASNVVADSKCPAPPQAASQAVDSREYEWRLYCISKKGVNFATINSSMTAELVETSGWKNVSQNGFKFQHKFIGQGIYELQLRARYNTYDYRKAGIIPVFTQNPDLYIDMDGGNDGGGVQDTSITAPFTKNMVYYCKSATGGSFPENTIAKRLIFVGQKVPDFGCWVAGRTFVYSEKVFVPNNGKEPFVDENDWDLRGSVGTYFSGNVATLERLDKYGSLTVEPISIYEKQRLWFETVLAVKYFKNVDEQTLADLRNENNATTSTGNESYDLNEKIHDLFSGVVPGSVTFDLKVYDGGGSKWLTIERDAVVKLIEKWQTNPVIDETDCPGLNGSRPSSDSIKFSFDTQKESFGSGNISSMINTLGAGTWDLSWVAGSTGGLSGSKYVPDLATIGMFYLNSTHLNPDPNGEPDISKSKTGAVSGTRGPTINMRFVTDTADYDTPTVGRVGTTDFDQNCLRAIMTVRGDVKEWDVQPSGSGGVPGYMTGSATAPLTVALSYETKSVVNTNVKLLEIPIDILVRDTSPPGTTISYFNEGKGNGAAHRKFTQAASSGDFLSNDIVVTVTDNNPFYSIYPGYSDASLIPNAATYSPDFSIAVAKTYRPKFNAAFTPEPNANYNWYDLTDFALANVDPVKLVPSFSFMDTNPPTTPGANVLYNEVKGRKSVQVFTVPAYSACIDPNGGWVFAMDWNAGTPQFTRPVCSLAIFATSLDGSGNGSWKTSFGGPACIPDKDTGFEQLMVPGTANFQGSPVSVTYSNPIGSTALDTSLIVDDNDPPEIYFAVFSNITNYGFTLQNKKYVGQDDTYTNFEGFNDLFARFIGGKMTPQEKLDRMYSDEWLARMTNDTALMKQYIRDDRGGALSDNSNESGRIPHGNFADPSFTYSTPPYPTYVSTMADPNVGGAGTVYISGYLPVGNITAVTTEYAGGSPAWGFSPAGGQGGKLTSEVDLVPLFRDPNTGDVAAISIIESSRFSVNIRAVDNHDGVMNLENATVVFTNETPQYQNIIPTIDGSFVKSQDPNSADYIKTFIAQTSSDDPKAFSIWSLAVHDSRGNQRKIYIPMRVVPADFKVHTLGRKDQTEKDNR